MNPEEACELLGQEWIVKITDLAENVLRTIDPDMDQSRYVHHLIAQHMTDFYMILADYIQEREEALLDSVDEVLAGRYNEGYLDGYDSAESNYASETFEM